MFCQCRSHSSLNCLACPSRSKASANPSSPVVSKLSSHSAVTSAPHSQASEDDGELGLAGLTPLKDLIAASVKANLVY